MTDYHVSWAIEEFDCESPREAALAATQRLLRNLTSGEGAALVFQVSEYAGHTGHHNPTVTIDLSPDALNGEEEDLSTDLGECRECGLREAEYQGSNCPSTASGSHVWVPAEDDGEEEEPAYFQTPADQQAWRDAHRR